jgi:hypothetical protein
MSSFHRWVLWSVFLGVLAGCADGIISKGPLGSLTTNLTIASGVDITEINYEITGQGFDPLTGTFSVTTNPLTATLAGIPAGTNRTIKLFTSPGASASCSGSATFDIKADQTTTVQVLIQCQGTSQRGTVSFDGIIMPCPALTAVVVSPPKASLDETMYLSATAADFGQGPLTFLWTATAGILSNNAATTTIYTCSVAGNQTVSVKATNINGCYDSLSVNVNCGSGPTPACGNGTLDTGEICDTAIAANLAGACPTSCDDGNACTLDALNNGGTCQAVCANSPITQCKGGDGCCPDGCTIANDTDCSAKCGDRVVTSPETCDPPTSCPSSCDDGIACTTDIKTGSAANCNVVCSHQTIASCVGGDGCCPNGCTSGNDTDCLSTCGNGVVDAGETCDPPNSTTCSSTCQACADLTGTWITRVTIPCSIDSPNLIGTLSDATLDSVMRMVVTKTNGILNAQFDICSLSTSTPSTSNVPISIAYSSAVLATLTADGSTQNVCSSVGGPVTFPSFAINSGWGGVVPTTNDCPSPPNGITSCSGAVDSDGDGIYGITLPLTFSGAFTTNAYTGLTFNVAVGNTTLTNATTVNGALDFTVVGYIYGNGFTPVSDNLSITPNTSLVSISAIKLSGAVPCATVLQHCTGATCAP